MVAGLALGAEAAVGKRVVGGDPAFVGGELGDIESGADVEFVLKNTCQRPSASPTSRTMNVSPSRSSTSAFQAAVFGLGLAAEGREDIHALETVGAGVGAAVDDGADVFERGTVVGEAPATEGEFAGSEAPAVGVIDAEGQGALCGRLERRERGRKLRQLGCRNGRGVGGGEDGSGPARIDEFAAEGAERLSRLQEKLA